MLPGYVVLNKKQGQRVVLWALVAAYTIALPNAIFVYNTIVKHFSTVIASKVPLVINILFGISYIVFSFLSKKRITFLWFIIPCVIIVYIVISFEPNPNKHIHIPEYVLFSWILFEALSIDYRGKGIYILLFICASMLGIVDELQQGIYPERFYGLNDMVINSTSVVIGVLTLMGLRSAPGGDWTWISHFRRFKESLGIIFFGGIGATLICVYLFDVKEAKVFWVVYPFWLIVLNCLFLVLGPAAIFYNIRRLHKQGDDLNDKKVLDHHGSEITAHLWILSIITILFVIHALVVFVGLSGWEFN